jgi:hypothetical protein
MFEAREHETVFLHILRWTARAASVVCLAIILLFLFGEGGDFGQITAKQIIGFLFFPVGTFVGLVLAWREEGLGGAIVVGSILAIYLIYGWLLSGSINLGWAFLPFLVPGLLFLAYRLFSMPLLRRKAKNLNLNH